MREMEMFGLHKRTKRTRREHEHPALLTSSFFLLTCAGGAGGTGASAFSPKIGLAATRPSRYNSTMKTKEWAKDRTGCAIRAPGNGNARGGGATQRGDDLGESIKHFQSTKHVFPVSRGKVNAQRAGGTTRETKR